MNDNAVAKSLKLMDMCRQAQAQTYTCAHTEGNYCEMILYGQAGVNHGG